MTKKNFRQSLDKLRCTIENKKNPRFIIPEEIGDITTTPYNHPPKKIVEKHIESLMDEFKKFKMVEYVDIYNDNHAMFKLIYHFDRYVDTTVKKRCVLWCQQFNYAINALMEIKKIKSETIYT